MTRLFALAAGLTVLAPATAAAQTTAPLVLADGTPYDRTQQYQAKSKAPRLISVAGYDFRAAPGPNAPPRGDVLARFRTTAFLQYGVPWQTKSVAEAGGVERKYHLMALVNDDLFVQQMLGWVPDHLLLPVNGLTSTAMMLDVDDGGRRVPTRVPRRGMVVNTQDTVHAWQKQQRDDPRSAVLFDLPAGDLAAGLDAGTCPPELLKGFENNGLVVGKEVTVARRPDVKGDGKGKDKVWGLTFRDGPAGGVQQYVAAAENGRLAVKESASMAWVYGRPASDNEGAARAFRRKSFAVSNVFFAYQMLDADLNPVDPNAPPPGKTYCLVGSSDDTPDALAARSIHGWIETSRLSQWPTTMALEWDRPSTLPPAGAGLVSGVRWETTKLPAPAPLPRRTPDGLLFFDPVPARGWMTALNKWADTGAAADKAAVDRYRQPGGEASAPVSEVPDAKDPTVSRRLAGLEMRFPVLGTDEKHKKTQKTLYKLGWFGPIKSAGGRVWTEAEKAAARKKMEDALRAANTVDLLFVIDGTGSMTGPRNNVVPNVLATCLTQLDEIRRGVAPGKAAAGNSNPFQQLTVRARVVLYGREKGRLVVESSPASNGQSGAANPAEVVSAALGAAAPGRIRALADWVKGKNLPADGTDAEEPVFDALLRALAADANPDATKFLILMADMPDVSARGGAQVEREKSRPVIRSLAGFDTDAITGKESFTSQPRNFFAVQLPPVGGWENPAAAPAADRLTAQLRAIEKELKAATIDTPKGEKVSAGIEAEVTVAREQDPARLNARIRDIWQASFDRIRVRLEELVRDTEEILRGNVRPDGVAPASFRHWLAQGINLDELAADGVQVYEPVFGYARIPTPAGDAGVQEATQLRTVFLVQRERAADLRNTMKTLVDGLDAIDNDPAKAKNAIENIVGQLLKDDQGRFSTPLVDSGTRNMSLTELYKRLTGIEFPPDSVLDLDALLEKNKGLPRELQLELQNRVRVRLLLAYQRLNELLEDNTEGDYRVFDGPRPGGVGTEIRVDRLGLPTNRRQADRAFTFPGFPEKRYLWLDQEYHIP